jgi:N6-L-threonylcarbamoyladenine synthase
LGTTIDDAIGEAFDKVAKMLGLPYPGGPHVERAAHHGDPLRFALPRPMLGRQNADFSLSGLKTAVRLHIDKLVQPSARDVADLCAAFQMAVIDIITDRVQMALRHFDQLYGQPTALVVAGGVAANAAIGNSLQRFAAELGVRLIVPPLALCTDNGAMIAWVGIEKHILGVHDTMDFAPRARWPLDQQALPVHHGKA